ncbi:MAG: endolytic transglycosylase MltG [Microbacterium sp.]
MPDATSPFDDPFADLFGKLPDPRERRATSEDAARGAAERVTSPSGETPANPTVPLSRREAREAAARRQSGAAATTETSASPVPPAASTAAPGSVSSRSSAAPASSPVLTDDAEDWPLTGAAAGASPSYRRSGNTMTAHPAATATLEDLFTGTHTTDSLGEVPPPKDKRKRRIGGWIALGVVLLLLGGIAAGGFYVWSTYEDKIREVMGWEEPKDYEAGMANGETFVTVASGDTGGPISQSLYEAGVTKTPEAFYDYLIDTGQNPPFVPGVFKMQKQMTSEAALAALLDPANKMENTAQLREGLTVEQSLPILAEGTGIPLEEYQAAVATPSTYGVEADSLEGWLFPATYTFEPGATATDVIATLVDRAVQSLDAAGVPVEDRQRILTIASIIQREARFEADFYKVSRVIQNRLDSDNQETFGLLQMDSTAQYGYGELHDGTVSSSGEALADDNPWNTYVHPGLPVGPISNPGDTAIDAAMHPADGDWLYFVTVNLNTGETVFTTNVDDHNRAVAQWQAWCTDNPDAGC